VLELRNLVKQFPGHRAVDDVSLTVAPGAFYSLLGPSGCGKTTTLRLVAGFERPDAGGILLNGAEIREEKPYRRNVSTVFQNYALFPHLTVRQNVEFGLRQRGTPNVKSLAQAALGMVQLEGKDDRLPAQLSGGERQRVALARSLVLKPDVLLLDEPLAALDPQLRKQMRRHLKELQRQAGIAFLFVTHDQEEALSLSDRIAVMNRGKIEQEGTPEEVYLRPASRFVAGFLGHVNWFGEIGIRPESTRLYRRGEGCRASVTHTVFLGNCVHVFTRTEAGDEAVAELPRDHETFLPGEPVVLHWNAHDEMRFPA
jgi:ABC-type Fe3+/spermidine/putrescine transport system ATPase subunit